LFLRWFLRTPIEKWIARNLPGYWAARIGERASAHSRRYTSEIKTISSEKALNKLHKYAVISLSEQVFDLLVTGHIHIADDYEFLLDGKSCRSVNLGTWLNEPTVFFLSEAKEELMTMDAQGELRKRCSNDQKEEL
jgi:UDP-2,3-diacylglucosamine hydrolase